MGISSQNEAHVRRRQVGGDRQAQPQLNLAWVGRMVFRRCVFRGDTTVYVETLDME